MVAIGVEEEAVASEALVEEALVAVEQAVAGKNI